MRASQRSGLVPNPRQAIASAVAACGVLFAAPRAAHAVTPIAYSGGNYAEDFNSLPSTPGNLGTFAGNGPFDMPNGLPAGWSFGRLAGAQDLQFVVGNGNSAALGLVISAGLDNDPDRALASASTTPSQARFGLTLVNNTQQTLNQFTIQFANEQWRTGGGTSGSSNTFAYAVGANATDINTGTFTQVLGLHVGSIAQSATATGPVNGNDAGFRRVKGGTVNGFNWAPGEQLILRWDDVNAQGSEDWLGIDDFTFSAGHVRNLRWNTTSGAWNTDPANTPWLDETSAPASFQTGDNVFFGDIAADSVINMDAGVVLPNIATISNAAKTYTFTGGRIAQGTLIKNGAGNIVLTAENTYEGPTSLAGGSVETQASGAFSTGAVAIADTTWKITTNPQAYANVFTSAGTVTIHADQPLTLAGATLNGGTNATLIFENASTDPLVIPNMSTFAGAVHARTGTIKATSTDGDLFSSTTILTVDPGATVDFSANGESIGAIQGGGTIAVGDVETATESFLNFNLPGDHTFSGVITGTGGNGFIMRGGGAMTLTGPSTFTTQVIIENGAIAVGANVLPDVAGPLGQNSTPINMGGAGTVTNSASLLIAGPYEFARAINVPANTNAGTITLGGNTDATSKFTGAITLERPLLLTSATTGTNVVEFAGNITSPAAPDVSVTKVGPGSVLLSGTHTYTGPTLVREGTLRVSGSIADSQGVTAQSGGTFEAAGAPTIIKSLTVETGGIARVAPVASPRTAPNVLKTTSLSLQPDTALDLTNGALVFDYAPGGPSEFDAVRSAIKTGYANGSWTGTGIRSSTAATTPGRAIGFAEASTLLGPAGGTFLGTPVDGSAVVARYTVSGDASLDGKVDFTDLVALAQHYNDNSGTALWTQGDFTYDGHVDFGDLVALAQNYNQSLPSALIPGAAAGFNEDLTQAFAAVPEPAAQSLLALAASALAPRRRRR
jgi:autotransporter-associated beta strand protein